MNGADVLDTSSIFASIGAFQASPQLGCVVTAIALGVAVARRSPSLQSYLMDEHALESPAARYFFKTPAKELPAPKKHAKTPIIPEAVDEPTYIAPRQAVYPAPVQRGDTQPIPMPAPTRPTYRAPVRETLPTALFDGTTISVYLGDDRAGDPVYAPIKHGIIANSTGGGKTNTLDLIIGQLLALGVDVWAATPKYVPIAPEDKLPRHYIYDALPPQQRALRPDDIHGWIVRAAAMVESRYTRMQHEPGWFPSPTVVILDELKAYLRLIGRKRDTKNLSIAEGVNDAIQTILTLGRECSVFLVFTSQDGYCGSIEMTKGEIGNLGFRLVHPSLDENSQRNLLPPNVPSSAMLGPYDWYCAVGNAVQIVSIPRVSSAMLAGWGLMERPAAPTPHTAPAPAVDAWDDWTAQLFATAPTEPDEVQALRFAIARGKISKAFALAVCGDEESAWRALFAAGMAQREIARLWGGKTQTTNDRIAKVLGNAGNRETEDE